MFVLGAIVIPLNPLPAFNKVEPSKVKPASPCIADALVAVTVSYTHLTLPTSSWV